MPGPPPPSGPALPRDAPPPMPEAPAAKRQRTNEAFVLEPEETFLEKLPGECLSVYVDVCCAVVDMLVVWSLRRPSWRSCLVGAA